MSDFERKGNEEAERDTDTPGAAVRTRGTRETLELEKIWNLLLQIILWICIKMAPLCQDVQWFPLWLPSPLPLLQFLSLQWSTISPAEESSGTCCCCRASLVLWNRKRRKWIFVERGGSYKTNGDILSAHAVVVIWHDWHVETLHQKPLIMSGEGIVSGLRHFA